MGLTFWEIENPSGDDIKLFWSELGLSKDIALDEFNELHSKWEDILLEMNSICFGSDFGFQSIHKTEWLSFISQPKLFQLSLNRDSGRFILYGLDHVLCRRRLFNDMPKELRLFIFKQKAKALELETGFLQFDKECGLDQLVDVQDIGMGHSVYRCSFASRDLVVKHRPYDTQKAYLSLMEVMGWPTFDYYFYDNQFGPWEFSESLGDNNCNDYLYSGRSLEIILPDLAQKAVLGDVFGIGDRHFENYMIHNNHIFSVDVSIMFWPDNEKWSSSYIAAGLYEITALRTCLNDWSLFLDYWDQFFYHYRYYMNRILDLKPALEEKISLLFSAEESRRCIEFLETRLNDSEHYVLNQEKLYLRSFIECVKREPYKASLARILDHNIELQNQNLLYKMYYLSDKKRLSTFLHSENKSSLFESLHTFCVQHDTSFLDSITTNNIRIKDLNALL